MYLIILKKIAICLFQHLLICIGYEIVHTYLLPKGTLKQQTKQSKKTNTFSPALAQ